MVFYTFELSVVLWVWGGLYLAFGAWAGLKRTQALEFLRGFHRNQMAGSVLFYGAIFWVLFLVMSMDLMEYSSMRGLFSMLVVIGSALVMRYMRDYLAVRSLGLLILLAAKIALDASFMRHEPLKIIVPTLVYLNVLAGLFLVGLPYLFRDGAAWLASKPILWKAKWIGSLVMGVFLVALGFYF
jgi:hypothetical protein